MSRTALRPHVDPSATAGSGSFLRDLVGVLPIVIFARAVRAALEQRRGEPAHAELRTAGR